MKDFVVSSAASVRIVKKFKEKLYNERNALGIWFGKVHVKFTVKKFKKD